MLNINLMGPVRMLLVCVLLISPVLQANVIAPKGVIEERYQSLLKLVEDKVLVAGMPEDQLLLLMEKELDPVVDFPRVSRKVMGKFARQATDQQLSEFNTIFKRTLVNTYSKGLDQLDQLDRVEVAEPVLDKKGDRAQVSSVISLKGGQNYRVIYSLFLKDKQRWMVENIIVEGVNIGIVFRNQFAHYMEQYGENIDQVLAHWGE